MRKIFKKVWKKWENNLFFWFLSVKVYLVSEKRYQQCLNAFAVN